MSQLRSRPALVAQRWKPDLVLLELALPDLPGDPDAISDAYAAGACDHLAKPLRTGELLDGIRVHLAPAQAA